MSSTRPTAHVGDEIAQTFRACKSAFVGVGIASFVLNLLTLSGSLYMLQVYDRVIPSRSTATLVGLTLILAFLYAVYSLFDIVRSRLLARIAGRISRLLEARAFALHLQLPLCSANTETVPQPLRDLDQIRAFISGLGPTALFDLPWLPFFLALVFLLHPYLGLLATFGAIIIVALTLFTEIKSRAPIREAGLAAQRRLTFSEAGRRNAEAIRALGMGASITGGWIKLSRAYFEQQEAAAQVAGTLGAVSKVLRMLLQSLMLGLGAYLAIRQEASGGVMIAASIMSSRALAPIDVAIANWRGFISARQSFGRLRQMLQRIPETKVAIELRRPEKILSVQSVVVGAPGQPHAILQDVSFEVKAGAGVGVIGPSAAGKSTLARTLVGVWRPARGTVRLDGHTLDQWEPDALGQHIGYLPQDVELFNGTIARNIARFSERPDTNAVFAASAAAGVNDMIAKLPDGYGTVIGEGGCALSAGQRQRIGLARALYKDPFLVVLDEPNSNLDGEGEEALTNAIRSVRQRGGIVVVIAHRPSALAAVDQVLFLNNGRKAMFGPRDEVLKNVVREPAAIPLPAHANQTPVRDANPAINLPVAATGSERRA